MKTYLENYEKWMASDQLSTDERSELQNIQDNDDELRMRFTSNLSFGTAGLRGTMKTGMNAMNRHTVAQATQGLANLIIGENRQKDGVAVCFDCRNNSRLFAETAARVLAANGIQVYLFAELRPTPELSFALRELHCVAGINITASHNPKEYNGYKAYWQDGAQLPPEHADTVAKAIEATDVFKDVKLTDLEEAKKSGIVKMIGKEIDEAYLKQVQAQAVNPEAVKQVADDLKIVYTPLHGTGYRLVPEILKRIGLKHLYTVSEQMVNDGDFPTVKKPNPEYADVFDLGIKLANEVGSDLIIATDPDADRTGVMVRKKDGSFITVTGNQMGALLADYIITAYRETDTMPENPYVIKSIVSTELVTKICERNHVRLFNVLTGFKFIGEVIKKQEKTGHDTFLFGFEESYGYLKGTYARDKDAVVASMLICEMTAYYKAKGMTLSDAIDDLYARYGFSLESTEETYMPGVEGPAKMAALMDALRNHAPTEFGGIPVAMVADYLKGTVTENGKVTPTGLATSNVVYFRLQNGDIIVVRPSGTEPKVKFYYMLNGKNEEETKTRLAVYREIIAQMA